MASICSEQPPLDLPDSPKSSDSFSSLFDFDDDTVVSNVEIANPFDQAILSKKFLYPLRPTFETFKQKYIE